MGDRPTRTRDSGRDEDVEHGTDQGSVHLWSRSVEGRVTGWGGGGALVGPPVVPTRDGPGRSRLTLLSRRTPLPSTFQMEWRVDRPHTRSVLKPVRTVYFVLSGRTGRLPWPPPVSRPLVGRHDPRTKPRVSGHTPDVPDNLWQSVPDLPVHRPHLLFPAFPPVPSLSSVCVWE